MTTNLIADLLTPIIFANGLDDDTNGMIALLLNQRVRFDDVTYEPGERVVMTNKNLIIDPRRLMVRIVEGQGIWISTEIAHGQVKRPCRFDGCFFQYVIPKGG